MSRCGCILYRPRYNDFLVVKQAKSGYLGFPKGGSLNGEDSRKCAQRETFEEVGIIVPIKVLNQSIAFTTPSGYLYYLVNTDLIGDYKCVIDGVEIVDFHWMSLYEISTLKESCMSWSTWQVLFMLKLVFLFAGFGSGRYY